MVRVRNLVEEHAIGSNALNRTQSKLLAGFRDQKYRPQRAILAVNDGVVVGRAGVTWWPTSTARPAVVIGVHPEWRNRGIGTELARRMDSLLDTLGICQTRSYATHTLNAEGGIHADDPGAHLFARMGYELSYCERIYELDLHTPATPGAGLPDDCDFVTWTGASPSEWVSDLATLHSLLSTDIPAEDPGVVDTWDVTRVRAFEAAAKAARCNQLTVAIACARSNRLVGFLRLEFANGSTIAEVSPVLIHPDFRGRGLGRALLQGFPQFLQQTTVSLDAVVMNVATVNVRMVSASERVGFRAIGIEGRWVRG